MLALTHPPLLLLTRHLRGPLLIQNPLPLCVVIDGIHYRLLAGSLVLHVTLQLRAPLLDFFILLLVLSDVRLMLLGLR